LPKLCAILFHITICSLGLGLEYIDLGLEHIGLGLKTAGLGFATAGIDYKTGSKSHCKC